MPLLKGGLEINEHDIRVGAELALPHRLKRQPFQDASLQPQQLQERMEQVQQQVDAEQARDGQRCRRLATWKKKR